MGSSSSARHCPCIRGSVIAAPPVPVPVPPVAEVASAVGASVVVVEVMASVAATVGCAASAVAAGASVAAVVAAGASCCRAVVAAGAWVDWAAPPPPPTSGQHMLKITNTGTTLTRNFFISSISSLESGWLYNTTNRFVDSNTRFDNELPSRTLSPPFACESGRRTSARSQCHGLLFFRRCHDPLARELDRHTVVNAPRIPFADREMPAGFRS